MRFSMRFSSQKSSTSVTSVMKRSELWKAAGCRAGARLRQRIVAALSRQAWLNRRTALDGYPQLREWRGPLEEIRRISG
jgi:hypothetical protein